MNEPGVPIRARTSFLFSVASVHAKPRRSDISARESRTVTGRKRRPLVITKPVWWLTADGDKACLALYEKHYSSRRYQDGRTRVQFVGPGEKVVLRTFDASAFFVWRKFIDDCIDSRTGSKQLGVNCAAFRNESGYRSSDLIRQADAIAALLWPNCRHYTYVDAQKIASRNPGYCFQCAGWTRCGRTKAGLIVFEKV